MENEVLLLKGNEAIAHAAIRCGCDGYFGYPITPQSEVLETLAALKPWETTGMVVLQAESEVASINMLYGGGGTGKRVMTSSSSVGIALMQEGISYMAGAEVPGLIVNVQRGGPGLGTIQPSQSDYNQATRGGGNGDYNVIVLAPNSVQEMADFVDLAFSLAFKYRNPTMILSDGVIGLAEEAGASWPGNEGRAERCYTILKMENEVLLLKGNEAIAHAAIRCGCDGYFGYPITPQSEVLETLAALKPWETTGMVVLQAESEVASINMLYGGGGTGKRVMTSSSSVGIALMQEGISYMAGAEVPGLIVNVQRGGPGLGTIQPSQSDYNQATRGGGNGDYNVIVLAPNSVQEMADFVDLAFSLAFKYRNPTMILSDGVIGQMMERVVLPPFKPRRTEEEIAKECPWAANGHGLKGRKPNIITSLELDPAVMEKKNLHLQAKYAEIEKNEVRYETTNCEDADYVIVAFGSAARISQKAMEMARKQGIKVGLFRPITLWPFPTKEIAELSGRTKGILTVEINAGQMVFDVRAAVEGRIPVDHFGRLGGIVPDPDEIIEALKKLQAK